MELISNDKHSNVELIHDLDHPEDNLIDIANIEASYSLSAKYFVRIHAKNYNPFSLKNTNTYKKIIELGHSIGLHFEPSFYESKKHIYEAIAKESDMLAYCLDTSVNSVSIHEPSRFGAVQEEVDIPSNLRYYCWNSSHYSGKKYISDSSARWREGCMCQHIGKHSHIIILTHPIWWFDRTSAENY